MRDFFITIFNHLGVKFTTLWCIVFYFSFHLYSYSEDPSRALASSEDREGFRGHKHRKVGQEYSRPTKVILSQGQSMQNRR